MQTINKKAVVAILFVAFCATLSSFSPAPGGDKFEIYINKKLVVEHYVTHTTAAKTVTLFPGNYNNRIDVYYSHCGQTGKDRRIIVMDAQNKVIKKWEFANASGDNRAMSLTGKDLMDLQKKNQTLQLYYASKELPEGRLLASVVSASSNYTRL